MKITSCTAREITDSRGNPTIEVTLVNENHSATAAVPSGKSTGAREARELRDPDGKGVSQAISNVSGEIAQAIVGKEWGSTLPLDQYLLALDGTHQKERLGGNSLLGVSIAAAKLFALEHGIPVWKLIAEINNTTPRAPRLFVNVINGGAHADFKLPFQEYLLLIGKDTAEESYRTAQNLFAKLGGELKGRFGDVVMGDEGGYVPPFEELEDPFRVLHELSESTDGVSLAIDAAASQFYRDERYHVANNAYDTEGLATIYERLTQDFNLTSIEDPFDENDVDGFERLTQAIGDDALVVGDDITVTNTSVIRDMIDKKAANAVIIKPNQIGTLSEVYGAVRLAHEAGWKTIVSHRSGETLDPFIADLAFGLGTYGLKAGAPSQEVRRVKYERLVEAEKEAA